MAAPAYVEPSAARWPCAHFPTDQYRMMAFSCVTTFPPRAARLRQQVAHLRAHRSPRPVTCLDGIAARERRGKSVLFARPERSPGLTVSKSGWSKVIPCAPCRHPDDLH